MDQFWWLKVTQHPSKLQTCTCIHTEPIYSHVCVQGTPQNMMRKCWRRDLKNALHSVSCLLPKRVINIAFEQSAFWEMTIIYDIRHVVCFKLIIYRLLAGVNFPMICMHVHAIEKTPKRTFWNVIYPRNMTIKIHWFISRFAILDMAYNLKKRYDYRVYESTTLNKNAFCKSRKRDVKVPCTQTWLHVSFYYFVHLSLLW